MLTDSILFHSKLSAWDTARGDVCENMSPWEVKMFFLAKAKRLSKSKFHILYILYILYSLDCFHDAGVACGSVTAKSRVEHVITAVSSQNEAVCYYGCLIGQYEASLNVLTKIL